MAQGPGLAGNAAAFTLGDHSESAAGIQRLEGGFDDQAQVGGGKIFGEFSVVDRDVALALEQADAGDGFLATAGALPGSDHCWTGGRGDLGRARRICTVGDLTVLFVHERGRGGFEVFGLGLGHD